MIRIGVFVLINIIGLEMLELKLQCDTQIRTEGKRFAIFCHTTKLYRKISNERLLPPRELESLFSP